MSQETTIRSTSDQNGGEVNERHVQRVDPNEHVKLQCTDGHGGFSLLEGKIRGMAIPCGGVSGPPMIDLETSTGDVSVPTDSVVGILLLDGASKAHQEIDRAAARIDPYTARMVWTYELTLDPYGLYGDLPPELQQVGREYFLEDPKGECHVLVHDVRELHPEIDDEEWGDLMDAAYRRDTSVDLLPVFHAYAPRRTRPRPRTDLTSPISGERTTKEKNNE